MTGVSNENNVALIVGPTAVGKTEIALRLAERLGAEIVSADSRQIYCHLNIGTAKPSPDELLRIPHHFIDVCDPDHYYSAGEYARAARRSIADLLHRGVTPLVVGGSGFYLRALVDGLFAPELSDPEIKAKWREAVRRRGVEAVHAELRRVDPKTAARLHPNDSQRIVRAMEVFELSGRPLSSFQRGREEPADFTPLFFGLRRERPALAERIDRRVEWMIEAGLADEVRDLAGRGWGPELNALRSVGYQEVFEFLAGRCSWEETIRLIKLNTRRYAKRQMTWFRRDARIHWIDLDRCRVQQAVEILFGLLGKSAVPPHRLP